jgi:hypothetical protein
MAEKINVNLRQAAFLAKELRSNLSPEAELSVDAYLHTDDYREILEANSKKGLEEYETMLSLAKAISVLRGQIQHQNHINGVNEKLNLLEECHQKMRLIGTYKKNIMGASFTDKEVERLISRQEKKEESDSYYGSSSVYVADENLVEFFEKQEKTVSKRIRMIQDDLTSINMSVRFDVEPEVAEWIRRLDIMD